MGQIPEHEEAERSVRLPAAPGAGAEEARASSRATPGGSTLRAAAGRRSRSFPYLDAGFKAPLHFHSADHYATTVSGNLVLKVDGREQQLAPGSYFSFTGKAPHAARCDGSQACVMFIDARVAWDIVPVPAK